MKAININGFTFQSWWGGDYVDPSTFRVRANEEKRIYLAGPYNRIRQYHDLELISHLDLQFVHVKDKNEYLSLCGYYEIVRYGENFYVYSCSIWRENLKSSFGKYVPSIGNVEFSTFEEASEALIAHLTRQRDER